MNSLKILFFSDAHYRANGNYQRNEVLKHITSFAEKQRPELVVFTGDLAFSGKENEYKAALESWKKLKNTIPSSTFVWLPGNHDLVRSNGQMVQKHVRGLTGRDDIENQTYIWGQTLSWTLSIQAV